MKFSINSGALTETITAAISSLPSRPTSPILGGILVEAQIGAVTFSTFNYDRATIRVTPADVMDTDTTVVSGRLLAAIASNLPKNTGATVAVDGNQLAITAGRTTFRLPLMHAHDYPHLPEMATSDAIGTVDRDTFTEAVKIVGGFASTDPLPANLTALNILCQPGVMTIRGTDRYIIGHRRIGWDGAAAEINVAAADVLATTKALTAHAAGDIEILWNGSMLGLRTPTTTVMTRVLELENAFPPTQKIMACPQYFAAATVPTDELLSMLRRATSIADDQFAQVDVEVDDGNLSVATTHSTVGSIVDALAADHHGGNRRVAVSSRRLHAALSIIDDPDVTLGFRKEGLLIALHPGRIGADMKYPDTDSSALVAGILGARN